jgi:hypothetical protein
VIVMTEISMTSIWSHSTFCHSHLSTRILFLMIGLFGMTALTVGQVRERETSYNQESLRRIRDGQPNSDLKLILICTSFRESMVFRRDSHM